ncbi:glucose-6-phosphate dehydrogenase [Fusibacter tunisiensis]|uniref:Glucose-6-phosphate 1-dehydrogenase n=1 Tax=Fusibacter tunisiensis TaxID=1008308 RepID=A0ABS2MSZ6_9FIRM|nr:glucose-6-phosphate dehydrogenase [Fusibacter tunisiensis]MBM7562558.1 glucose-6-phosphate 1-dehydrogenase [Fusibacter tunisiensis]
MLFTIFGATGDLTTKKLIPALYNLYFEEEMPENFKVINIGRRAYTSEAFVDEIREKMSGDYPRWEAFKKHLLYFQMDFSNSEAYPDFKKFVEDLPGQYRNRIFYLATAPRFFPIIAQALIQCKMIRRDDFREKIVFEKPFGEDLASAKAYNRLLLEAIDESQVFRIDHYLGKEMLQNILMVRFANKIFENIWNSESIESVKIYAMETESVKQRGGYYDHSGALKDMVQNHLFQTLSLVAMEPPGGLNDNLIKDEKVAVLDRVRVSDEVIYGQYAGYQNEKGIAPASTTETFVGLKLYIDTPRWKETPFYLVTGKMMSKKRAGIEITFKDATCFFEKGMPKKNKLFIEIFPREGLVLQFNGKAPGLAAYTMPMKLDYCHLCNVVGNSPEAYEKLISDVVHNDASLFTRWDEIESSWRIIDAMIEKKGLSKPVIYGSESEILSECEKRWKEPVFDEDMD